MVEVEEVTCRDYDISSPPILPDSCSVVKELIDYSLDACALAIFIELSVNSLDMIQVIDNGPGIHPKPTVPA